MASLEQEFGTVFIRVGDRKKVKSKNVNTSEGVVALARYDGPKVKGVPLFDRYGNHILKKDCTFKFDLGVSKKRLICKNLNRKSGRYGKRK